MSASDSRITFERFLAAINSRDADALDDLLHPDFQDQYPQSGEVTRGVENIKSIIRNHRRGYEDLGQKRVVGAEDRWVTTPMFTTLRVEGSGNVFTGLQRARYPDGSEWYVVVIGERPVRTFSDRGQPIAAWRRQRRIERCLLSERSVGCQRSRRHPRPPPRAAGPTR